MVRHATPLVVAPVLPSADRLEILVARARLHHQPVGLDASEETLLTVLLSFDPTEAERRAARVVAASFIAADCSFESAPPAADLRSWPAETLSGLSPLGLCMVIALPAHEVTIAPKLRALVDTLRTSHQSPLIVGVATAPADWAYCGFDGFVLAKPEQRVTDALRVFSMLAAVMAPGLMCCLDAEDFLCALGTPTNPSQLAEAVYLVEGRSLVPASRADEQILSGAGGVAVMPSRCLPISTQALLVKRVRARAQSDAALTLVAPYGLTVEPPQSRGAAEVLLLCRPT